MSSICNQAVMKRAQANGELKTQFSEQRGSQGDPTEPINKRGVHTEGARGPMVSTRDNERSGSMSRDHLLKCPFSFLKSIAEFSCIPIVVTNQVRGHNNDGTSQYSFLVCSSGISLLSDDGIEMLGQEINVIRSQGFFSILDVS
ncbi:hypothetical protein KSP40_PGU009792 [Platanthera guangdongensis]|uniref:DNA recombination and repair protein Rad51-like C-terminal domain-containing protein n=1 Tax=Platanthera guangdongensis TaxID=2320717 RepID=A0ABR2LRH4_9ASPA